MRCYFFGNMYFSSIQQGIQALHATSEMFVKYRNAPERGATAQQMLYDWAEHHKTVVLLNGGDHDTLTDLLAFMTSPENPFAFAPFYESSANNVLSSVGIVLPEEMFDKVSTVAAKAKIAADSDPTSKDWTLKVPAAMLADVQARNYTPWEIGFLVRRVGCPLAI